MFGMNKRVWILRRKIDGRYNKGKVVGIEKSYEALAFLTETQYLNGFKLYRYKIAYVDVTTGKGYAEWLSPSEISDKKPE